MFESRLVVPSYMGTLNPQRGSPLVSLIKFGMSGLRVLVFRGGVAGFRVLRSAVRECGGLALGGHVGLKNPY